MRVAIFSKFAASRKEPLIDCFDRVRESFVAAGLGEPTIRFKLSDAGSTPEMSATLSQLGVKRVSSIDRILKRWPELGAFVREGALSPAVPGKQRVLVNLGNAGEVLPLDLTILRAILGGVPKSFPAHHVSIHLTAPGFSSGSDPQVRFDLRALIKAGIDPGGAATAVGINIGDSWWVNGRQRSLAALRLEEADPAAKKLPPPPAAVAAIFAACGKVQKTSQIPVADTAETKPPTGLQGPAAVASPEAVRIGEALWETISAYRKRLAELAKIMPHDIPLDDSESEASGSAIPAATGSKKPALLQVFGPMGYDCKGSTGAFTLSRRTPGHLIVELDVDVGTWRRSVGAAMRVRGMAGVGLFRAPLPLPASPRALQTGADGVAHALNVRITGPERWRRIVENLGVLVSELDRTFVPEVEAIVGSSPAWLKTGSA